MSKKTPNHNLRGHSRISPSGLKSLQVCPGYESMQGDSKASIRGTALHEVMDSGVIPPTMSEEDQAVARQVLDILKTADGRSQYDPLCEIELDFTALKLKDFDKGHADRVIVLEATEDHEPLHVEMIDFKFGQWAVDSVKENIQFRAYAVGLFLGFPSIEKITVRIIQPALNVDESHTFSRAKDYDIMVTQIGAIVRRRHKWLETRDASMLKTDEINCSFCDMQATCAIWQQYQVKLANEANILECPVMPITSLEDVDSADPEEVVRVFRWIKPMEDYLKKLKRFALNVYDTGRIDSGLNLIEKNGDATIVDPLYVRDFLQEKYGITNEEFLLACEITVGKIKELVGDKAARGEKGKMQDEAIELLSKEGIIQYGPQIRYVQLARGKKS
jgi:hypothetical protein